MANKTDKVGFVAGANKLLNSKDAVQDLGERAITTNNAIGLGALGTYIAMVGYHENGKALFGELSQEKRFFKFGLALVVLNYSIDKFLDAELRTIAKTFMWAGLLLTASTDGHIFDKITEYFKGGK